MASPFRTSTLRQREELDLNPGEDMDVCQCIVPARHGGTLNGRRAAKSSREVGGRERWEVSAPQSVLLITGID
ncbi:hypothetical protein TNCV_4810001 [Trichonephila clavipes]|uniref:Uncharacterized protein n=1 Tax=Trichonephila clavipes TaxID=2585209 RepID=A0A8X6RU07_TRICX|nr:hypothetical protein TNCV_4810001 [Trichonephila clavipes]